MGFDEGEMETLTGRIGLTVIVNEFEVAGLPEGQIALEVNTQITRSPLISVVLE
jgi:hypothetical protein